MEDGVPVRLGGERFPLRRTATLSSPGGDGKLPSSFDFLPAAYPMLPFTPPQTPPQTTTPTDTLTMLSMLASSLHTYARSLGAPHFWLSLYFASAAAFPILSKYLLRGFFPFPWILTSIQLLAGMLGTFVAAKTGGYRQVQLSQGRETILVLVSLLVGFETLASNASLKLVTVPVSTILIVHGSRLTHPQFYLSVRALSPVLTLILNILFFGQRSTIRTASCLLTLILGVGFTSGGFDFASNGAKLTILSTILASLRSLITDHLLIAKYGLHPLDFFARFSRWGLVHCAVFAIWTGEIGVLWKAGVQLSPGRFLAVGANGYLSFQLFLVTLLAEKRTTAPSLAISGKSHSFSISTILTESISVRCTSIYDSRRPRRLLAPVLGNQLHRRRPDTRRGSHLQSE
jgi:hypothetical protein